MNVSGIPISAAVALAMSVAVVLALLHLLRVRPRPIHVVTTLFWQQAIEQPRARTLWQRFRHPRTYALLAAIGALLALALANPQLGGRGEAVSEVIVLDAGVTMGARADTERPSRFDEARKVALAEAARLALSDNVAVVAADPGPRLLAGFDAPRPELREALEKLAPASLPSARGEALALAADLLRGRPAGRILLVTDRPREPAGAAAGESIEVRTAIVGEPTVNAGILGAQFSPYADDPLHGDFLVRIGAWGPLPRDVEVRISRAGGAPLLAEAVTVAPAGEGGTAEVRVRDVPADGDELLVQLGPADGLAADDSLRFRLPLRRTIRVGASAELPESLRLALLADPACRLVSADDEYDVLVHLGAEAPATEKPILWLPSNGSLVSALPIEATEGSPFTAGLDFASATCAAGAALPRLEGEASILLAAGDEILADWRFLEKTPSARLAPALLADDSEAARTSAFPILVSRGVRQLAGWTEAPLTVNASAWDKQALWDRLSSRSDSLPLPAARDLSDTTRRVAASAPPLSDHRRSAPEGFEWLVGLAGLLLIIEAVLHTRGRIP